LIAVQKSEIDCEYTVPEGSTSGEFRVHSLSQLQMLNLVGNSASRPYGVSQRPINIPQDTDPAARISEHSREATTTHMVEYTRQHLPQSGSINSGMANYESFSGYSPGGVASTIGNGVYPSSVGVTYRSIGYVADRA
jgi:hypothetical protein